MVCVCTLTYSPQEFLIIAAALVFSGTISPLKASASHRISTSSILFLMPFFVSDMPLSFNNDTTQEEIDRRRAERMARKEAKHRAKTSKSRARMIVEEKEMFPNLTGDFDEESPFAKHLTRERDH